MGDFSQELCGGCHATATGDIGLFKITGESAVAAGVRRIEGVTGQGALDYVAARDDEIDALSSFLKTQPGQLTERVTKQADKIKGLEKENRALKEKLFSGASGGGGVADVDGVAVIAQQLDGADAEAMRAFVDDQKNRHGSIIVAVGAAAGDKALLTVGVTDDLCKKYPAGKIIKAMAAIVGGGGGGRPDMAQAGGKNPAKLPEAIAAVPSIVAELGK